VQVRSDPPNELGGTAERAKASSPVVGRRSTGDVATAPSAVPPDEFGGSYESECRPAGPYGALKLVPFANGFYDRFYEPVHLFGGQADPL